MSAHEEPNLARRHTGGLQAVARLSLALMTLPSLAVAGPYPPAAGLPGSSALAAEGPSIVAWVAVLGLLPLVALRAHRRERLAEVTATELRFRRY